MCFFNVPKIGRRMGILFFFFLLEVSLECWCFVCSLFFILLSFLAASGYTMEAHNRHLLDNSSSAGG